MRIQRRPVFRATAGVTFASWQAGCEAVRHLVQAKLWPANLRILDPAEGPPGRGTRRRARAGDRVVRVSRADPAPQRLPGRGDRPGQRRPRGRRRHPHRRRFGRADRPRRRGRGLAREVHRDRKRCGNFAGPDQRHLRDGHHLGPLARLRRRDPHSYGRRPRRHVSDRTTRCRAGSPTCTPTAPRPTTLGRAWECRAARIAQWQAIKDAAIEAVVAAGGTVTHHHAVGRMHRPGGYGPPSGPSCSPRRCGPSRSASTPTASSTPASSSTPEPRLPGPEHSLAQVARRAARRRPGWLCRLPYTGRRD